MENGKYCLYLRKSRADRDAEAHAEKFLKKQTKQIQQRIISAIEKIPLGDIRKLQGQHGYRLRVGTYRILFNKDDIIINIIDIDSR